MACNFPAKTLILKINMYIFRVLRPPGGASSFSFGNVDQAENDKATPTKQNQQSNDGLVYGSSGAAHDVTESFTKQQDDIRAEQEANKKQHDTHSTIFGNETVEHRSGKGHGRSFSRLHPF